MKNYEVTIFFPDNVNAKQSTPNMRTVELQANSAEAAVQAATKPAWYDVGNGVFFPASAITMVGVDEQQTQAVS